MFKNFFFFSKGQRVAILVLLLLIVAAILLDITLERWAPKTDSMINPEFRAEVESFEKELFAKNESFFEKDSFPFQKRSDKKLVLFEFDPNTLDSAGFVSLGLKPYIAKNILKYRLKGGLFKTNADFSKVYGISELDFSRLEPFLKIDTSCFYTVKKPHQEEKKMISSESKIVFPIELNAADTTLLKQCKGTVARFAKRIVAYRALLGGYFSVEQLSEIYGMTASQMDEIRPLFKVDVSKIKPMNANKISVEKMKKHPYLNFYQAKAIFELRGVKKELKNINELKHLEEFKDVDLERIKPYLCFDCE